MIINTEEWKNRFLLDTDRLNSISEAILKDYYEEIPDFSLIFVEPEAIRELNNTYRQVDAVTDVLSFEYGNEIDPETGREYIGDIIICAEQAQKQAEMSGHSVMDEICLLEIHGLLHLLGYDHMEEEQKEEMWKYQNLYLDKFGINLKRRPGEDFDF